MPAILTDQDKGPKNKYLGIRIWSAHPEHPPKAYFSDLKILFVKLVDGASIKDLLKTHPRAAEVLEALP